MTAPQSKYTGWLIHLTAWAVIFGMPLFVTGPDRPLMNGPQYIRFLLVPLSFMVVFYTNFSGWSTVTLRRGVSPVSPDIISCSSEP